MSIKRFDGNTNIRDEDGTLMVGLMIRRSVRQQSVTVTSSATPVPSFSLSKRVGMLITNVGSEVVYLGNPSVNTADGYPLYPRGSIRFEIEDDVILYGIASSSSELRILEGS